MVFSLCSVLLGCKTLVRENYSEPQAVGDRWRVLGLVPIIRYEVQAYRLLVCKRRHLYSEEVFADHASCRVALHDRDGNEVAFFSNDFQRSFVTKYKGYAKQAVVTALATVPVALVGILAGSWRMLKLTSKEVKNAQALRLRDFDQGKYSEALINNGVGRVGVRYYMSAWSEAATRLFDDIKTSTDADEIKAKLIELEQLTSSYRIATEVSAMTGAKKTLEQLRYTYDEKHTQAVTKIEQSIVQRNGNASFSAKGTFSDDFFQMHKRLQSLFQSSEDSADLERLQSLTAEIELLMKGYVVKLPAYEKLYADASVLAIDRSALVDFERHFSRYKGELEKKQTTLLEDNRMRYEVEQAHMYERTLMKSVAAGGGGSAATLGVLQALDKSIWGYEERQLHRYWQHVFVADDDFANPRLIDNLPQLLQALADAFDYKVNPAALEL